jgi:hypothetical protein
MGQGRVLLLLLLLEGGLVLTSSSSSNSCRGLPGQLAPCAAARL